MEQIKERVRMIKPKEWEDTHLEAHEKINAAISQFYGLFDDLIGEIKSIENMHEDAEDRNFASFSKLTDEIKELRREIKSLEMDIDKINRKLDEWGKYITWRYEWILDTDKETTVDLETIGDEELKWRHYLANIVIHEASPNQWTAEYKFPQTSLAFWEYTPRMYLKAKEWEHAVLEYDFTVILTEI